MTIARVVFNLCLLLSLAFGERLWLSSKRSALRECFNDSQVCYCRDREPTEPLQQQGQGIIENFSQLVNNNSPGMAHVSLYLKRLEELISTTTCITIPTFYRLLKDALIYAQQTPKNIELLLFLIENYKNKKSPDFGPTDKTADSPDYATDDTPDDSDTTSEELPYENPESMVDNSTPKPTDPAVIVILNNIILHKNFNKKQNIDYILYVLKKNQNKLHSKIYEILVQLLKISKRGSINKLNDIMLLLINNEPGVFSDRLMEALLLILAPNNGLMDPRLGDLILNLLRADKLKDLDKDQLELLAFLLKPNKYGLVDPKIIDVLISILDPVGNNGFDPRTLSMTLLILKHNMEGKSGLDRFNIFEILHGIKLLRPNELRILSRLLQLEKYRNNPRVIEIIFKLLTKIKHLTNREMKIIFWLLVPDYGSVQPESIELIEFLLDSMANDPKSFKELMAVFENNVSILLHSKFLNIILELYKNHLLNNKLLGYLVSLIKQEVTANVDQPQIAALIQLLEQHTQYNPQVIIHIIDTLKKTPTTTVSPEDYQPDNVLEDDQNNLSDPNDLITPKYGDLLELLELLKKKGGAQKDLILQYLMNLSNLNNAGVVELTYILKNQRPVVINPVYYVKYRVPIPALISTLKVLFTKDPYLASNPTKLLQQLISIGNLTEMSPGLSAYPREEIIKQTHQKGDLIQAKLLDYKTLHLNDQIALVHQLSTDNISPAELLQLNELKGLKNVENNLDISSYISSSNQDLAMKHLNDLIGEAKTYYFSKPDVGYSSIIYKNVVAKPVLGKTLIGIQDNLKDTIQDVEATTLISLSL